MGALTEAVVAATTQVEVAREAVVAATTMITTQVEAAREAVVAAAREVLTVAPMEEMTTTDLLIPMTNTMLMTTTPLVVPLAAVARVVPADEAAAAKEPVKANSMVHGLIPMQCTTVEAVR